MFDELICPDCRTPIAGWTSGNAADRDCEMLPCVRCCVSYPVIKGIPRMIREMAEQTSAPRAAAADAENHAADFHKTWHRTQTSFGRQWLRYDVQTTDEDKQTFENKTGFCLNRLSGMKVLDAGCGGGRYAFVTGSASANVTAVDISLAVEKTQELCRSLKNVAIIQANLMSLPFSKASFDRIYSIGVLHHTPDTRKAFEALIPYLKPGGEISIWLYPKWDPLRETMNRFWRSITTRLPHAAIHTFSRLVSPFGALRGRVYRSNQRLLARILWQTEKIFPGISNHPDPRQRVCDTFDWLTPQYQWHHTDAEVRDWFRSIGLTDIRNLSEEYGQFHAGQGEGVCFTGKKPAAIDC
ncbi:MAG: methyltransferase domain-containing protein [Planctomycetaceae bacterium]